MIKIVGLGPGHASYVLPIALSAIKDADLVIGAKRHLDSVHHLTTKTMDYSNGFDEIGEVLLNHDIDETIVLVVSGDVGFYSMLDFVKRTVKDQPIELVPGISSLQYLYSKLGFGYEESKWVSLHGRNFDLKKSIRSEEELGILLDRKQNNQYIAKQYKVVRDEQKDLFNEDRPSPVFYVGERLSYEDEQISRLSIDECIHYRAEDLSVVIVRYE